MRLASSLYMASTCIHLAEARMKILHSLLQHLWDPGEKKGEGCSVLCWKGHTLELSDTMSHVELEAHLVMSEDPCALRETKWTIQMLSASGFHNTVKYMYSGSSYSDHFLDATNKGPHSLSEHHRMTGSHPKFPVERCQPVLTKAYQPPTEILWFSTLSKQDTI